MGDVVGAFLTVIIGLAILAGMSSAALVAGNCVVMKPALPGLLIAHRYRDILQRGGLLGEAVIAKKAAAVSVTLGKGKVVLLGFRPQHRAQTHGTFKLVFNALLNTR